MLFYRNECPVYQPPYKYSTLRRKTALPHSHTSTDRRRTAPVIPGSAASCCKPQQQQQLQPRSSGRSGPLAQGGCDVIGLSVCCLLFVVCLLSVSSHLIARRCLQMISASRVVVLLPLAAVAQAPSEEPFMSPGPEPSRLRHRPV